jgi:hypothetical protein
MDEACLSKMLFKHPSVALNDCNERLPRYSHVSSRELPAEVERPLQDWPVKTGQARGEETTRRGCRI